MSILWSLKKVSFKDTTDFPLNLHPLRLKEYNVKIMRTKNLLLLLLLLLMLPVRLLAQQQQTSQTKSVAFTHVTVIDMTGAPPRLNMTVVITGDRISAIESTEKINVPKGTKIVKARGKFLIPGLWDMHVHLGKAGENTLPLFIANGVTSVRDMGGDYRQVLAWRKDILAGIKIGPRIKTAGPILESDKNVARMKSEQTIEPVERTRIGISNPQEAKEAVDFVANLGVDFVKVRTFASVETYLAIAEAARKVNLPLASHASRLTIDNIIQAKVQSIEHSLFPPLDKLSTEQRREIFKNFVANNVTVVPTLITGEGSLLISNDKIDAIVEDTRGLIDSRRKYLTGYLIDDWREQAVERKEESDFDLRKFFSGLTRDLREMKQAGVILMPGTDVAVVLIYPGFSLHDELRLFVTELGMTPMEALLSATRIPAEFFKMQNSLGTIEVGKIADLVLLEANPLENIQNTRKIESVISGGKLFLKPDLKIMMKKAEIYAKQHNKR